MFHGRRGARAATRRFLLGSGALKRGSDRVQVLSRVVLVLALVAAAPLAVWRGTSTHERLERVAAEQAATRRPLRAVVLADALQWPSSAGGDGVATLVSWVRSEGRRSVAKAIVPNGTHGGDVVRIWVDRHGDEVPPPLDEDSVVRTAAVSGLQAFAGLTVAPLCVYAGACLLLGRFRDRQWARGWAAVEPEWKKQMH